VTHLSFVCGCTPSVPPTTARPHCLNCWIKWLVSRWRPGVGVAPSQIAVLQAHVGYRWPFILPQHSYQIVLLNTLLNLLSFLLFSYLFMVFSLNNLDSCFFCFVLFCHFLPSPSLGFILLEFSIFFLSYMLTLFILWLLSNWSIEHPIQFLNSSLTAFHKSNELLLSQFQIIANLYFKVIFDCRLLKFYLKNFQSCEVVKEWNLNFP
jgi:hypothetical protein